MNRIRKFLNQYIEILGIFIFIMLDFILTLQIAFELNPVFKYTRQLLLTHSFIELNFKWNLSPAYFSLKE